ERLLCLEEVHFRTLDVDLEQMATRLAKTPTPVFFEAHTGHKDSFPSAGQGQALKVRQVARRADVRFVKVELREVAPLSFARDAMDAVDFGHGVGSGVPARLLDGLRVGVEHQTPQRAASR